MRCVFLIGFVSACIFAFGGCAKAPKLQSSYWPTDGWRTSTPEQQGLDSQALVDALDAIQTRSPPIHSLLMIRHGQLVLETYFYPYSGNTLHSWASVTKSITSTLIGLAVGDGAIRGAQQRIIDFYPEYRQILTGAKERITVKNLLTMTTGLECGYEPGELEALAMQRSSNFIAAALKLPIHTDPGNEFSYCSGGMHVLSSIVTRATGMSALQFAQHRLFEPLRIKDAAWPADPQGVSYGWASLRMHPRDMAKIGYLFLHQGAWDGQPIISSNWIQRATRRQVVVPNSKANYGYGWWIGTQELSGAYFAAGRGGQRVVVWPEKDLVVITNGAGFDPVQLAPLLLAAFKSNQPLPENKIAYALLQEKIALALTPPKPTTHRELPLQADKVSTRTYVFEPNLLDIERISLTFEGQDEAELVLQLGSKEIKAPVGLDGIYRFVELSPEDPTLAIKGHWINDNEFVIDYTEANGIQHFQVTSLFRDDKITMKIEDLTGEFPTQTIIGSSYR
jgi:CubicO group peptidase (beta-lactamase class C family)